jgi:hypothetical protein
MAQKNEDTTSTQYRVERVHDEIQALIDHVRRDIAPIEDDRAKALFETTAEVLAGLRTAFEHYQEKREEAWAKR